MARKPKAMRVTAIDPRTTKEMPHEQNRNCHQAAWVLAKTHRMSKTDVWAGCQFEIVISAVVKVDFVASFHANSEMARIELQAASWIKHPIRIAIADGTDLV